MRIFVSRRAIHRRQARAMAKFFLALGFLALVGAAIGLVSHVSPY